MHLVRFLPRLLRRTGAEPHAACSMPSCIHSVFTQGLLYAVLLDARCKAVSKTEMPHRFTSDGISRF